MRKSLGPKREKTGPRTVRRKRAAVSKRARRFTAHGETYTVSRVPSGKLEEGSFRAADGAVYAIRQGRRLVETPGEELVRKTLLLMQPWNSRAKEGADLRRFLRTWKG